MDTSESLTLDTAARERATEALSAAIEGGHSNHFCAEWQVDGACEMCWSIVGDVLRAAEGLQKCSRCNGMGTVGPEGDACPQCAADGLWPLSETAAHTTGEEAER